MAKIVGTAEKIYSTALNSTRFGRFLVPVIESATKAEIAGRVFTQQKDELNFLSFMAGGVVSESLGVVFAKMPKEQVYNYLKGIFGNKIDAAINVIKKGGELTATGIGETGEETMQELIGIYQRTDGWQEMKAELDKQFGTFDQVQEFLVSSFIMGAGFGLTESKSAKEAYDKLPPQSKEQVDAAIEAIRADLDEADSKVEEFAENKEKQQAVEKTIEENDKKDEEGVSGQVGEGQESVEGQPTVEETIINIIIDNSENKLNLTQLNEIRKEITNSVDTFFNLEYEVYGSLWGFHFNQIAVVRLNEYIENLRR